MTNRSERPITPGELTAHWQACYGVAPLAHHLRTACADRWVRIYGLPDGKRYPETEDEYAIVLARHNELLSSLIDEGQEAVLITTGWSWPEAQPPVQEPAVAHSEAWHWITIRADMDDPEAGFAHLYARSVPWHSGTLDSALRLVADDQIGNVMVLGIAEYVLYHPYDGGADVIARDQTQRDMLKDRFRDWVSPLASGL